MMHIAKAAVSVTNAGTCFVFISFPPPLVKVVAGRLSMYLGYNVEYDDLVSYGVFGLIDAIDKFDTEKEVKFETYASLRIRGAVIFSSICDIFRSRRILITHPKM